MDYQFNLKQGTQKKLSMPNFLHTHGLERCYSTKSNVDLAACSNKEVVKPMLELFSEYAGSTEFQKTIILDEKDNTPPFSSSLPVSVSYVVGGYVGRQTQSMPNSSQDICDLLDVIVSSIQKTDSTNTKMKDTLANPLSARNEFNVHMNMTTSIPVVSDGKQMCNDKAVSLGSISSPYVKINSKSTVSTKSDSRITTSYMNKCPNYSKTFTTVPEETYFKPGIARSSSPLENSKFLNYNLMNQMKGRDRTTSECSVDSDDSFVVFRSVEDEDSVIKSESDEDSFIVFNNEDENDLDNSGSEEDRDLTFQSGPEDDEDEDIVFLSGPENNSSDEDKVIDHVELLNNERFEFLDLPKIKRKKVSFKPDEHLVAVHHLIKWNYAYRAARPGPWEMYARDRFRFQNRIHQLSKVLNPILEPFHRAVIFEKRFLDKN